MPSVTIGPVPVRISQAVTDQATLQNTGNETIYMDTNSAVSSIAYGISVSPRASLNWSANQELWAVTESADSTLSILYGGEGVTVSEVGAVVTGDVTATIDGTVDAVVTGSVEVTSGSIDAVITGDVTISSGTVNVGGILTPVDVQGGGTVLVNQSGNLTAGSGITINIPAPASGLTYAGIGVILRHTSNAGNVAPLVGTLYNNGFAVGSPMAFQAGIMTGDIDDFGVPSVTKLVAPVGAAFPLRLDINNGGTGTKGYTVIVVGLSYSDTVVRDFGQWENGAEGEISFDNVAINSFATIAASFETRQYLLVSASGTVGNFVSDVLLSTGSWQAGQLRVHNNVYGNVTPTSEVQPNVNSLITIPGDGRIHRIRNANAVTGFVRLTYLGKIT